MVKEIIKYLCVWTVLCVGGMSCVQAGLYRWVDQQGNVHYSDVIPPAMVKQGHAELNKQGMTTKRVAAAPTAKELAEKKRQETMNKLRQTFKTHQKEQDKYLLANYSSVDELEAVYKSKLRVLDKNTRSMQERRDAVKSRLAKVKEQLNGLHDIFQRQKMERYVHEAEQALLNYMHALQENQTEYDRLTFRFEQDRQRLLQLLNEKPKSQHPDSSLIPVKLHEERDHQ